MALRIHFAPNDLVRLRIRADPDPMWELVLSLHVLQSTRVPAAYSSWRRRALRDITAANLRNDVRPLTSLVAPRGDFPDFLTPPPQDQVEAAIEATVSTPRHRIRHELGHLPPRRGASGWRRSLADGRHESLTALARALTLYHTKIVDTHRHRIDQVVHADRELRISDLLNGGTERLLSNLPQPIAWQPPTLHTDYPHDRDIHLNGRGLTLIPSYFCWGHPVTLIDPDLPPVLVYPAAHIDTHHDDGGLPALLGPTRARALDALRTPTSTSELAQRSGMSITSASKHTAVLRHAKLITSLRQSNTMIHILTPLGRDLLDAQHTSKHR